MARKTVVIRTYPEEYEPKPGVEEIAGEISLKTLEEFVRTQCRADPGCCGYRIEEVDIDEETGLVL